MKTVGMITIYRKNYGAFLQAYALQQTLKKLGYAPEIIRYDYYKDHTLFGVSLASKPSMKQLLKAALVETVRYIPHKQRQKVFDESIKNNLIESKEYYKTYEELKNAPPQYDVYLTGSDQVFNGAISPQALPARLLSFVREGKKASYAASAGGGTFNNIYEDIIINSLQQFDSISVREESLKDYLRTCFGLDVNQHVDPVFLLGKTEWEQFASRFEGLPEKYIFYYRVLPQKELIERTKQLSEQLNLPIFVADGHDSFDSQVSRSTFLSPEEWVYCLSRSSYVVTNSFHGTAFSVNLGKKATVFVPPKGGERIVNLMKKCQFTEQSQGIYNIDMTSNEDNNYANLFLQLEKDRSYQYLKRL